METHDGAYVVIPLAPADPSPHPADPSHLRSET